MTRNKRVKAITENFLPQKRSGMSRAYFLERLQLNGFSCTEPPDYVGRLRYRCAGVGVVLGDQLNPHGITIVHKREDGASSIDRFADYGAAWSFLRKNNLIGLL